MRFLADENFPKPTIETLRANGHDVLWARTDCAGWTDLALLEQAEIEGRVVLTLDKDFWQIAVQRKTPLKRAGVVLFRLHPATPARVKALVGQMIQANQVWAGHVSIVSPDGIDMLPARRA